ncbi:MAG: hypothetical protein JNK50_08570 [Bacteroidia bacterium]|nr:hypothetical protein [Bacteroidia bacterium]
MGYKLFLDDLRTVEMVYTSNDFVVVRTFNEFVNYIKENGLPDFISFDNDLGEDNEGKILPDGYACAKWLVNESNLDLSSLNFKVHSANPVAKIQIESFLNNYLKFLNSEK